MRSNTYDAFTQAEKKELLTTGEAAKLLNSSRQHIVDLCERGDLPFTTIGKHRRVRRTDIEAIRTRTQRMSRDQQRSLWLSYAIAGRVVENPEKCVSLAKENLNMMRKSRKGEAQKWLMEWDRLLNGSTGELLAALTSKSPRGRELRQNSPFAGVLSQNERRQLLKSWSQRQQANH
jgi:excisionase family DNA binding protein